MTTTTTNKTRKSGTMTTKLTRRSGKDKRTTLDRLAKRMNGRMIDGKSIPASYRRRYVRLVNDLARDDQAGEKLFNRFYGS